MIFSLTREQPSALENPWSVPVTYSYLLANQFRVKVIPNIYFLKCFHLDLLTNPWSRSCLEKSVYRPYVLNRFNDSYQPMAIHKDEVRQLD